MRILLCLFLAVISVPLLAHAQSEPSVGDIQIIRNRRESVVVFPRVAPVDSSGQLAAPGDAALQLKQALENLRRLGARVGVTPVHFVTLTVYVKEKSVGEPLHNVLHGVFNDWNPAATIVEIKELRLAGSLVEVEGVAVVRDPTTRR